MKKTTASLFLIFFALIYSEFLADYVVLYQCNWPRLENHEENKDELKAMILADTHILGIRGHWLDKLYREWHMHRAFQAALTLHRPDVVFVLGDLFDEGDLINHEQFKEHVVRFRRHFYTNAETMLLSAVGNHDVGFHYKFHPFFMNRFEKNFNNTGVRLYSIKGIHFIIINSMAMENDGCQFCRDAEEELKIISDELKCLKSATCKNDELRQNHGVFSAPIIMQHFPTYRPSDSVCLEHDSPEIEMFRENWEVLSKSSTEMIGKLLKPRVAFAGHSHHYCLSKNFWGVEEYTVASFNWRNKVNPSFMLAKFSPAHYAVNKCDMLKQEHIQTVYYGVVCICALAVLTASYLWILKKYKRFLNKRL